MKPKIVFYDAYSDRFYGAQKTMYEIIVGLEHATPIVMGPRPGPIFEQMQAKGIETRIVPYPSQLNAYQGQLLKRSSLCKIKSLAALMAYNLQVVAALRREKADLVYCNNLRSVLSVGWASKLNRVPLLWYVQQMEQSYGYLDSMALQLSDRVVTISKKVERLFSKKQLKTHRQKLKPIYLGLDIEKYDLASQQAPKKEISHHQKDFTIAIVGMITPMKGHHILLDAVKKIVKKQSSQIQLWVIGDSTQNDKPYHQKLEQEVKESNLEDVVRFLGWRDDVPAILSKADVLVLPSMIEGLPRSIMEGMASSKPVVATNVGGVSELVVDGVTGLLIPPNDTQALHDALLSLIQNREKARAMGTQGRQRVEATFSSTTFLSAFNDLFSSMTTRTS